MAGVLNLKEGQNTSVLYEYVDRVKSLKLKNSTITGLQKYINSIEPVERFNILIRLAEVRDKIILKDFPYSAEDLSGFIKLAGLVNLPVIKNSKNLFQYTPEGGYSKEERSKRASQKRKQISEFNEENRRARERILLLKSQQLKEKDIEKILEKEKVLSLNGKKLTQGSINRIYHNFMGMRDRFRNIDIDPGRGDFDGKKNKRKKYYNALDLDQMGEGPVKQFSGALELIFKENEVPAKDFYVCFTSHKNTVNEILYVNYHYLNGRKLSINIKEQTILSPGQYRVFISTDPQNIMGSAIAELLCDLYREYIEVDDVRFIRNPAGEVIPFCTLEQW